MKNINVEQNSASKRTYNQENYAKHKNSTTTILQPHTAQHYCLRKWQLQGFTTLSYSRNCVLPLKRSVEESWPKYPYFCTTMHLLSAHRSHVGQAAILESGFEEMHHPPYSPDLAPSDYHLFRKFEATPSWTEIFDRWWAQVCDRRVVEGAVRTLLFHRRWGTSTTL